MFVPHNGCPHACSFCSQHKITGQSSQPTAQDVEQTIRTAIRSLGGRTKQAEIAFFGGSFTAIERTYMQELLDAAAPFVRDGTFHGIRLSTRPDAIDRQVLALLKENGVTAIELGAQSMSDEVLSANHRGHTAQDVVRSSELIRENGFSLGLQMMTGLYRSSAETDRQTAEALADLKPDTMRIYPTVVLKDTELETLYRKGVYQPPDLTASVELCAGLLLFFEQKNISVIRLGLHDSESLRRNQAAGAFHPAFRELCESEILYRSTLSVLRQNGIESGEVRLAVNPCSVSRFVGQKRRNLERLHRDGIFPLLSQDTRLSKYEVAYAGDGKS